MQYIKLFVNGMEITDANPLKVGPLNATNNEESSPIEVSVKTEAGFSTYGDTVISFEGTTAAKWSICATEVGSYAPTLTIPDVITESGIRVYVKARATEDEEPQNDTSVKVKTEAVIQAV